VAGLGGLGHLAVKFAVAHGADTSVISRSPDKAEDARRLGAHALIVSTDPKQMAEARDRFDVVGDTISAPHDLGPVTVETTDLLVGRKKLWTCRTWTEDRRPPAEPVGVGDGSTTTSMPVPLVITGVAGTQWGCSVPRRGM
jgi:threonine dehydrogenase-like Zn-dependent dehydrogenase